MMTIDSWDVIPGANSLEVVLAVDFPVTGRPEAGFPDLVANMKSKFAFVQTVPPDVGPAERLSGDAYVRGWVEGIAKSGRPVAAVLGYCVGAVYAAAIAEGVMRRQTDPPKVILFDPEYANVVGLSLEIQRVLGELGALLTEQEIEHARRMAAEMSEAERDDVGNFAAGLVKLYREVGSAAFARVGLGGDRSDELVRLFESYMSWMSVADRIDPGEVWRHATAIISNNRATLLNREPLAGETPAVLGRRIPFDVEHADLLRSEPVARMVLELLER
jgi:hypothetical protein